MPHTRSAKRRLRQSEQRRLQNRAIKSTIKTQIKKVLALAKAASTEQLQEEYRVAVKKLDKAAAKRVIHPNLAARKKSQLARLLHQKATAPPTSS
ncbi:MAG TPA: 30S ribosomal protein S20 [Gemmataceae bacterium]|nr:30S ribosomal protein S20 [Gemmataceae bacterium]